MQDLNDMYWFSVVVEHNGFTGAAKALGVARSSVSRKVAALEETLGVRLVQRDTRHFAVTDLGKEFNSHCLKMVAEAKGAHERVALARQAPSGVIRVACPALIGQMFLGPLLPEFVSKNPQVRIAVNATDREANIEDSVDLCIRVRQVPSKDSASVMRSLGIMQRVLIASRVLLDRQGRPRSPIEAARLRTLSYGASQGPHLWRLVDPNAQEVSVRHKPTLISDDIRIIRQAAVAGLGIAQLPLSACLSEIRQGNLEIVLPDFPAPLCEIQIIFPSRRGLLPAVRSFIDFLVAHRVTEVPERQIKRHRGRGSRDSVRFWTNREPVRAHATGWGSETLPGYAR